MSTVVPSLTVKVGRPLTRTAEEEKARRGRKALRARILKGCLTDTIRRKDVLKIIEKEISEIREILHPVSKSLHINIRNWWLVEMRTSVRRR
jgi:hypothetical protein